MSLLGTFILVHVFTAVLPPKDADEPGDEYYHVLGLDGQQQRATADDIKRAYRRLALELHPDKIAQRSGGNEEAQQEAQARFEKVQQAYAVLHDKKERQKYHTVHCSPKRYHFVYQQGWMHPMTLLENVTRASCLDKFRLVILVFLFLAALLLQPILIAAKVNAEFDQSSLGQERINQLRGIKWVVILIPFWILFGFYTMLQVAVFSWTKQRDILMAFLSNVCTYVGLFLLAREWDDSSDRAMTSVNWFRLATPFYLAIILKAASYAERAAGLLRVQDKLVSPEQMVFLTQQRVDANAGADLTQEQLEELQRNHVVVKPNDLAVAAVLAMMDENDEQLTDEEIETIRVQSSAEYNHLHEQVQRIQGGVVHVLLFGISMVSLIAARVGNKITVSWWIVFIPLWMSIGRNLLHSCAICLFGGADDEHLEYEEEEEAEAEDGDENENAGGNNEPGGDTEEVNGDTNINNDDDEGNDGKQEEETTTKETHASDNGSAVDPKEVERGIENVSDEQNASDENATGEQNLSHDIEAQRRETDDLVTESIDTKATKSTRPNTTTTESGTDFLAQSNTFFDRVAEEEAQRKAEKEKAEKEQEGPLNGLEDDDDEAMFADTDEEEAFRQWQRAHVEEENNAAVERALRAQWTCCYSMFQLLTCLLLVTKLDQDFDEQKGFNAFWVLFPVFLVAGIILCCACCVIYCTNDTVLDTLLSEEQDQPEENDEEAPADNDGGNDQEAGAGEASAAAAAAAAVTLDDEANECRDEEDAAAQASTRKEDLSTPEQPAGEAEKDPEVGVEPSGGDDINDLD